MDEEQDDLDDLLSRVLRAVREKDWMLACLRLAEVTIRLDHVLWREERLLSLREHQLEAITASTRMKLRSEHASLRRLVALICAAIDRGDQRRAIEVVGKLRSVLILHIAKEESLFAPAQQLSMQ